MVKIDCAFTQESLAGASCNMNDDVLNQKITKAVSKAVRNKGTETPNLVTKNELELCAHKVLKYYLNIGGLSPFWQKGMAVGRLSQQVAHSRPQREFTISPEMKFLEKRYCNSCLLCPPTFDHC